MSSPGTTTSLTRSTRQRRRSMAEKGVYDMTEKKVWFITGAGRGMGVDIVKAALAARHPVVATGRNPHTVRQAVGDHEDLLVVTLDVTSPASAEAAAHAAV